MNMAWNTVNYLGYLPANLEATLESAIPTPAQIPGLVSNLVYGLLSPDPQIGLFGKLLNNVVDPFTWLPAPIGYSSDAMVGLAYQIRDIVAGVVNGILSVLPAPVTPSALPSGAGAVLGPRGGLAAGKGASAPGAAAMAEAEPDGNPSDTTFLKNRPSEVQVLDIPVPDEIADDRDETDSDAVDLGTVDLDTADMDEAEPDTLDSDASDPSDNDSGNNDAGKNDAGKDETEKSDSSTS
jgi:hypothetical protein